MRRLALIPALLALLLPSLAREGTALAGSTFVTHVRVPALATGRIGSPERITVTVTADGTFATPTGYVALWAADIPRAVWFASHTVGLDSFGQATFVLKQSAPGVPFSISGIKIYYVPTNGSQFAPSSSPAFTVSMDKWPSTFSLTPPAPDGNGVGVPLALSLSSGLGRSPVGGVTISDTANGTQCGTTIPDAFLYAGTGQATVDADLPAGQNNVSVTYLGDAYYAAQTADATINVTTAGHASGACPAHWARLGQAPTFSTASSADVPMQKYGFPRRYGVFNEGALSSPNVGTLAVQLGWSDVEPHFGQFDFSKADAEVQAALAQGKKIALVLRFQSGLVLSGTSASCNWNYGHAQLLPAWVGTSLGKGNSFCSHGTALTIPKYWSPEFIALWTSYVDQVAAHFAPIAADIAYVRGAVGLGDEAEPITGPNSKPIRADRVHMDKWGFNPQLWEAWQEDMLLFYQQAFSYAPWVLYTIDHQSTNDKCTDATPVITTVPVLIEFAPRAIPCTGRTVDVDVAEWAVDHGFGLSQNSLDPTWVWRSPEQSNPSAGHVGTILAYALNHTPRPFISLQPFQAVSYICNLAVGTGLPHCYRNHAAVMNAIQEISYAHAHGASEIEWYEEDVANPALQKVIDLWSQLQSVPGQDQVPTLVTVTPAQNSVVAGSKLKVTLSVTVPGIAGFKPGGTIVLADDLTSHVYRTVQIGNGTGSVTVSIKVKPDQYGHVNLSASYVDRLNIHDQTTGTWLWAPSVSANARVDIRKH